MCIQREVNISHGKFVKKVVDSNLIDIQGTSSLIVFTSNITNKILIGKLTRELSNTINNCKSQRFSSQVSLSAILFLFNQSHRPSQLRKPLNLEWCLDFHHIIQPRRDKHVLFGPLLIPNLFFKYKALPNTTQT